jgi:hypothetical protein
MKREDLPKPNYVLNTSPGKYQVVWKVDGFTKKQAEEVQQGLAAESGADPAATDSSRVLRLPGWLNQKYDTPHMVTAERMTEETYRPGQFPAPQALDREPHREKSASRSMSLPLPRGLVSQSERDWAFAREALRRGESKEAVISTLASYRRFDKAKPRAYAELTVEKASRSLERSEPQVERQGHDRG